MSGKILTMQVSKRYEIEQPPQLYTPLPVASDVGCNCWSFGGGYLSVCVSSEEKRNRVVSPTKSHGGAGARTRGFRQKFRVAVWSTSPCTLSVSCVMTHVSLKVETTAKAFGSAQ